MTGKMIIAKSNDLVKASYTLTIPEQRIILLCLAKLDSRKAIPDSYGIIVTVDELVKEVGVSRGSAYRDLKKAADKLFSRQIILNENGSKLRWVYQVNYDNVNEIKLYFSPTVFPYISELKERFLTYRLQDVSRFTCRHSIRIFELLIQRKDKNTFEIEVDELRKILEIKPSQYQRIIDLKRCVIDPALDDINRLSPVKADYTQVKNGRLITHLVFNYSISGGMLTKKKPKITKELIEKHARPGESYQDVKNRLIKMNKAE